MNAEQLNSSFGLASIKDEGSISYIDDAYRDGEPCEPTTWFEFSVNDARIQEVVDHLKKIGIDCDPRNGA